MVKINKKLILFNIYDNINLLKGRDIMNRYIEAPIFGILPLELIINEDTKLEIFSKRTSSANMTDFALAMCENTNKNTYWTKNNDQEVRAYIINEFGKASRANTKSKNIGIRPVVKWSQIKPYCKNIELNDDGVLEAEYGLFPNNFVTPSLQNKLDILFKTNNLMLNSNVYKTGTFNENYQLEENIYEIYEHNNKKYINIEIKNNISQKYSNNIQYEKGAKVWVELKPLKLWIDEKSDIAIHEDIIIGGIKYNTYHLGLTYFEMTDIFHYLQYFFKNNTIKKIKDKKNNHFKKILYKK